ncbi:hypothetical protein EMCRGX_G014027 [Ephydatia muelleri]
MTKRHRAGNHGEEHRKGQSVPGRRWDTDRLRGVTFGAVARRRPPCRSTSTGVTPRSLSVSQRRPAPLPGENTRGLTSGGSKHEYFPAGVSALPQIRFPVREALETSEVKYVVDRTEQKVSFSHAIEIPLKVIWGLREQWHELQSGASYGQVLSKM